MVDDQFGMMNCSSIKFKMISYSMIEELYVNIYFRWGDQYCEQALVLQHKPDKLMQVSCQHIGDIEVWRKPHSSTK